MTVLADLIIIAFLSFLAVASVTWYFRMRRKTLVLTKRVTEELEKVFKPVDKTYVLLGYLVGYRAKYELENGDRVYILFTTAPRHSILYYPIAKALKRTDRIEIAIENSKRYVARDLHAVALSDSRLLNILLRDLGSKKEVISKRAIETSRGEYMVYYEDSGDIELVKRFIDSVELNIYRLSAFTRNNLVELVAEIREDSVQSLVRALRELNRYVTKSSSQ
ncbi:MAG: hypothetical protein QXG17_03350 [Sulfolobales archaeon]